MLSKGRAMTPEEKLTQYEMERFLGKSLALSWAEWVEFAKAILAKDASLTKQRSNETKCTEVYAHPQSPDLGALYATGNRKGEIW